MTVPAKRRRRQRRPVNLQVSEPVGLASQPLGQASQPLGEVHEPRTAGRVTLTGRLVKFMEAAVIVLGLVALVAVATFLVSSSATKVYTAESKLVVIAGLGLEQNADVLTAPRIAQTFGTLAPHDPRARGGHQHPGPRRGTRGSSGNGCA